MKDNKLKIIDNLKINVIATFDNGKEQECFKCSVWKKALESEKALISYIKMQLDYPKDLVKFDMRISSWITYINNDVINNCSIFCFALVLC